MMVSRISDRLIMKMLNGSSVLLSWLEMLMLIVVKLVILRLMLNLFSYLLWWLCSLCMRLVVVGLLGVVFGMICMILVFVVLFGVVRVIFLMLGIFVIVFLRFFISVSGLVEVMIVLVRIIGLLKLGLNFLLMRL